MCHILYMFRCLFCKKICSNSLSSLVRYTSAAQRCSSRYTAWVQSTALALCERTKGRAPPRSMEPVVVRSRLYIASVKLYSSLFIYSLSTAKEPLSASVRKLPMTTSRRCLAAAWQHSHAKQPYQTLRRGCESCRNTSPQNTAIEATQPCGSHVIPGSIQPELSVHLNTIALVERFNPLFTHSQ